MEDVLRDVERALAAEAWIVALSAVLALPDICAAIEAEDGETTGARYKDWFSRYLATDYPTLLPDDCWRLRCKLIHQGRSESRSYSRLIFTVQTNGNLMHNNVLNDALNLDVVTFCGDVMSAVRRWQHDLAGTPNYERNAPTVLRWHRGGLAPYIGGVDVLS